MGKGQRAREARAGKKEELRAIAAKKKLQSKIKKIIGICAASAVAVAIVAVVIYNSIASTGYFLRNTVALKTDNFQVDNAMLTYYLKTRYYNVIGQDNQYLTMLGLDTKKSLKSQSYGDGTWFDYFLSQATQQAKETLLCAEKAKAEGYELTEEDVKAIDDTMAGFAAEAESYKIDEATYYNSVFGQGIKKEDVRRAVELSQLATNYYDDYMSTLNYDDAKLDEYFGSNKSEFIKSDYLVYELKEEASEGLRKDYASKIAKAKTAEEFKETVIEFYYESLIEQEVEKRIKDGVAEENAQIADEDLESFRTKAQEYETNFEATTSMPSSESSDEFMKWLFEDGRKAGDTKIVEEVDQDGDRGVEYTVYFVTNPNYYDDYKVKEIRHIMFSKDTYETADAAKAKAEEVLNEYKTNATEDNFAALATKYTEDDATKENGGLYDKVTKSTTEWPENLVNWSFDNSRKAGDVEVIEIDGNYHVMYYKGEGEILWKINAKLSLESDDYSAHIDSLEETYKPVIDEKASQKVKA